MRHNSELRTMHFNCRSSQILVFLLFSKKCMAMGNNKSRSWWNEPLSRVNLQKIFNPLKRYSPCSYEEGKQLRLLKHSFQGYFISLWQIDPFISFSCHYFVVCALKDIWLQRKKLTCLDLKWSLLLVLATSSHPKWVESGQRLCRLWREWPVALTV